VSELTSGIEDWTLNQDDTDADTDTFVDTDEQLDGWTADDVTDMYDGDGSQQEGSQESDTE
jgi:hypothetical protein